MESSVSLGLRATDLTGRITFANPAFCRMVGFEREELEGRLPPFPIGQRRIGTCASGPSRWS